MAASLDGPRIAPKSGPARQLIVFVHGYGADGNDLIEIGRAWQPLLPDTACEALRQYVNRGGSLVATFETSIYNEWGERRKDFGLSDVLGASVEGSGRNRCGQAKPTVQSRCTAIYVLGQRVGCGSSAVSVDGGPAG